MHKSKRFYRDMTPEKAAEMRRLYFVEKLRQVEIARLFGVAQGTVSRIISDAVWCRP